MNEDGLEKQHKLEVHIFFHSVAIRDIGL